MTDFAMDVTRCRRSLTGSSTGPASTCSSTSRTTSSPFRQGKKNQLFNQVDNFFTFQQILGSCRIRISLKNFIENLKRFEILVEWLGLGQNKIILISLIVILKSVLISLT